MKLAGKHVAITGASSGIGEALVRELARAGARLTLVSRREDLLSRLAREVGGDTFVAACDLADLDRATAWIEPAQEALGPIDVLVNNAGVQIVASSLEVPVDRAEAMLRVDLLAPLRITRAVLPGMRARGQGTIVDICSVVAFAPMPFQRDYNAAKAGLAAASESLRAELRGSGVTVLTVYPGPIATPLGNAAFAAYDNALTARLTPKGRPDVLAGLVRRAIELDRARVTYPRWYALTRHFPGTTRFLLDRFTPTPRRLEIIEAGAQAKAALEAPEGSP